MHCNYRSDGFVASLIKTMNSSTPSPILRTQLYYFVCIFLRLALYNLVYILRNEWYTPIVVGVFALLSIVNLSFSAFKKNQIQWWSKKFQFVIAVLVFVNCIGTYYKVVPTIVVPVLLYVSVLGGLIQRWTCCCW